MNIDIFYPTDEIGKKDDLEHKIAEQDVISHQDVKDYAQLIVENLKDLEDASTDQQTFWIVDALSDDHILGKFVHKIYDQTLGEEERVDEAEAKSAVVRIRKALIEELKGKIDAEVYLVVRDFKKNTDREGATQLLVRGPDNEPMVPRRSLVGEIAAVAPGRENLVYKDQEPISNHPEDFAEAYEIFQRLPPHPYIRKILLYDSKTNRSILEKRDFVPIDKYLEKEKLDKRDFSIAMQAVIDCLSAAEFLSDNGLVLQDSHSYNVGVEDREGKGNGLLFDPEGLVKKGKRLAYRIGRVVGNQERGATFLDRGQADPDCVSPKETVHQLAESILLIRSALADYYHKNDRPIDHRMLSISNQMSDLAYDMQKPGKGRLTLVDSLERLSEIKQKFDQYSL